MVIPDAAKEVNPAMPPMEARQEQRLPSETGWQFEPKWDGFRCLLFRGGKQAELAAKSGKSLARFFPEIVSLIERLSPESFALDGELIVAADGASFEALQMRLHPAESRIKRLSSETPATVILFDALAIDGSSLIQSPLTERREALEAFYRKNAAEPLLRLSPFTRNAALARDWLDASGGAIDGVVGKRLDGHYEPGKRSMIKVKRLRSADCVVGGFRYLERERLVGSLLLGLYNGRGELDHVGFTSAIAARDRPELTKLLEDLIEPPGFTGEAPAVRAAGRRKSPARGSRSGPCSSSKSSMTTSPQTGFATGQSSSDGDPTSLRGNAPTISYPIEARLYSKRCFPEADLIKLMFIQEHLAAMTPHGQGKTAGLTILSQQ